MKAIKRLLWLPVVLLLAGCAPDEFEDLQDFVKTSGEGLRGKIEAPPEVKPYEPFTYDNSTGIQDPFKPRKKPHPISDHPNAPASHTPEELESFPLESLKMVGYVYIRREAHGIVASPDGKVHEVKVGNYMGQNFGQITSITETEIKLKEMVQDSEGEWSERYSTMQLIE